VGASGAVTEKKLADIEIDAGNVGQTLGQRQVALVAVPS
jgi:hypothetical protein